MSMSRQDVLFRKFIDDIISDTRKQNEDAIEYIKENADDFLKIDKFYELPLDFIGDVIDGTSLDFEQTIKILTNLQGKPVNEIMSSIICKMHFGFSLVESEIIEIFKLIKGVDLFTKAIDALEPNSIVEDHEYEKEIMTKEIIEKKRELAKNDKNFSKFLSCCRRGEKIDYRNAEKMLKENEEFAKVGNIKGWTGLHIATEFKNHTMIRLLLQYHADPNAKTTGLMGSQKDIPKLEKETGLTPLHFAAALNDIESVRILLTSKADKSIKSANGYSPIDFTEDKEIKQELQKE